MARGARKSYILFLVFFALLLLYLELQIGIAATIFPFLVFILFYFVRPKFLAQSQCWRKIFEEKGYLSRFAVSAILFYFSFFITYIIGSYVEGTSGPAVPDIILNSLKPINFGPIPIYLSRIAMVVIVVYALFVRPTIAPFSLKAFSILLIVRSLSMGLTHLGLPAGRIPDEVGLSHVEAINFTKDLFFSGHVAVPFMVCLLFWGIKANLLKYVMLFISLFLSFVVLAMHLHYSIDVVAAFFFTYGIYKITAYLFKKDYELYLTSPSST